MPLEQTFVGVTEHNALKRLQYMNRIAFKYTMKSVKAGNQVQRLSALKCCAIRSNPFTVPFPLSFVLELPPLLPLLGHDICSQPERHLKNRPGHA